METKNMKDFMKSHYSSRLLKKKSILEIETIFSPTFEIEPDYISLIRDGEKYFLSSNLPSEGEEILRLAHNPRERDFYSYLKSKYGEKSTLKTKFIFSENFILLGDQTLARLCSTLKRECLK